MSVISEEQAKSSIVHKSSFLVDTDSLQPHPQAEGLLIPLSMQELDKLKESIRRYGIRVPLHILRNGTVLDGHHRLQIAWELGIEHVPVQVLDLPEERDQIVWMIRANLDRRQLTEGQRAVMAKRLYEMEQARAHMRQLELKERQPRSEGRFITVGGRFSTSGECGKARELAAKEAGISGRTLEKAIQAIKRDPSLEGRLKSGEISVHRAYTMAKAKGDNHRDNRQDMVRTCFLLTKEDYHKLKALAYEKLLPLPKFLGQLVRWYLDTNLSAQPKSEKGSDK